MRKTLIKKKQQHIWYYFYSHFVCWYKVIHLSQTSSVWVVKVKTDLTLHCGATGCPISKMISQANINRPIPVSIWQFPQISAFPLGLCDHNLCILKEAPFIGFLSEARELFFFFFYNTRILQQFSKKLDGFVLKNT